MRRRFRIALLAIPALFPLAPPAAADDLDDCLKLSYAPLDRTIPACDRLIAAGGLDEKSLYEALLARARASEWAITYHHGHDIEPRKLRLSQLADLDRAVGIARRLALSEPGQEPLRQALSERASVSAQLGQAKRAVVDYSEAIDLAATPSQLELIGRSLVYERLGRLAEAIADMTAIVQRGRTEPNLASSLARRAELYEAAANREAAVADYRAALTEAPDRGAAAKALERLGLSR